MVLLVTIQFCSEGLNLMKMFASLKMFQQEYGLEPGTAAIYLTLSMIMNNLKILCGFVIDSRVVKKRKYYLIVLALLQAFLNLWISCYKFEDAFNLVIIFGITNLSVTFTDAVAYSYIVQQARRDPKNGQTNL